MDDGRRQLRKGYHLTPIETFDRVEGYLEVGVNVHNEVVINLPTDMTGHVCFSPNQARALATLLMKHADEAVRTREERKR